MSQTKGPGVGVITSEPRAVRLISAWHLDGMQRLWAALPSGPAPLAPWEIPRAQVNVTVVTQATVIVSVQLHQDSRALGMPGSSKHTGGLFERPLTGNSRVVASRPSFRQPLFKKEQGLLCLLEEVGFRHRSATSSTKLCENARFLASLWRNSVWCEAPPASPLPSLLG